MTKRIRQEIKDMFAAIDADIAIPAVLKDVMKRRIIESKGAHELIEDA